MCWAIIKSHHAHGYRHVLPHNYHYNQGYTAGNILIYVLQLCISRSYITKAESDVRTQYTMF